MSFYQVYAEFKNFNPEEFNSKPTRTISNILGKQYLDLYDFAFLLSLAAKGQLEDMAQKAFRITRQNFGKAIELYTPLYLSNYCENSCLYCGFNQNNKIKRKKLTLKELEKEAEFISSLGLKHILILTGESRKESPVSYLKECAGILKKYFASISIEVYSLEENEYALLASSGVDGLVIYQEVYDEKLYKKLHPAGPKKDYLFRLDAPERGARSKMRNVSIGVLLGLGDWRKDVFLLGLHARYLQDKFPDVNIGVSLPRIRPQKGDFKAINKVSDEDLVQIILALRIFLPRAGISLSTREDAHLRENLIPLGVTRLSAGSSTAVGGHTLLKEADTSQFEINDRRSVDEIKTMLEKKGYQPVFKDWLNM